jgi:undecaprenyl-diphosphatase
VGTFGAIGYSSWNPVVKWICYGICILVPFSRMYLGVHTPADVLVGAALAVMMITLLSPIVWRHSARGTQDLLAILLSMTFCLLLFAKFFPFSIEESQLHNLESGSKNAYTMLGAVAGLMVVYPLERKYVNFETKAVWWAQLIKAGGGLLLVLLVEEGLKAPIDFIFGGNMIARCLRYFLMVVVGGGLWPMTFKWFSKLGQAKE